MKSESNDAKNASVFDPAQFLLPGHGNTDTALIILNSPITSFHRFVRLYEHSQCIVCADGGANRLYDLLTDKFSDLAYDIAIKKFLPTAVHGDLDSIKDSVRQAYAAAGVQVTQDPDQYSTDFQKALKLICKLKPNVKHILILGSIGGRVDQGIGLLHELYRDQCLRRPDLRFWMYTETSLSFVLPIGASRIRTPLAKGVFERNMGLLPIYGPAVITTHGLEWDVTGWPTEMGGNVSTSNHCMQDMIDVETDHNILFTIELVNSNE